MLKQISNEAIRTTILSPEILRQAAERILIPRKTVFDIDDTAWDLTGRVAQRVGVDFADLIEFRILENDRITMEQRQAINNCYRDPATFRGIQFYPGFSQIMELEQLKAIIQVNSNSFSEEVRDIKIRQTLDEVSLLRREEHLRFNVVNEKTTVKKRFDDDTFILVDDSPYNIAISPAVWNIVPRRPWNQTAKAQMTMANKPVIYVPARDFRIILRLIAKLLCPDFSIVA